MAVAGGHEEKDVGVTETLSLQKSPWPLLLHRKSVEPGEVGRLPRGHTHEFSGKQDPLSSPQTGQQDNVLKETGSQRGGPKANSLVS